MIIVSLVIIFCIAILGFGLFFTIEGIKENMWFTTFFGIIFMLVVLVPFTLSIYDGYQKGNATLTTEEVILTVSNKKHSSAWTQVISTGKTINTVHHPESWDISFIDDENNSKTIDNESLFESLNQGDKIEGYRDTYTKKNGEIYKIELRIKGFED
ncbi:hypothetical protein [Clostridium sp.]|uniref:hypothetical protein n=1 Tax=Clostridium sp. TaxID=1506 RepID=UPI002910CACC|nr:hypothetical protein [Clostridium sp.]MDU3410157.1 hypothetical protein [Clostridium sp.]